MLFAQEINFLSCEVKSNPLLCVLVLLEYLGEGKSNQCKKQSLRKNVLFLHEGMKDSHLVSTKD